MKSKNSLDAAIDRRLRNTRTIRHGLLYIAILFLLSPLIGVIGAAGLGDPSGAWLAALPLFGAITPMMEEDLGGPGGGGNADDDDPLATKILAKIQENKTAMEEIEKTLGEHEETKKHVEEMHKAIKACEGLDSDVKQVMTTMAKMEARLANVRREVSGDPQAKIVQDEEMRAIVIAAAKSYHLQRNGRAIPKEIQTAQERFAAILSGEKKALTGGTGAGSNYIDDELATQVYQLAATYGRWAGFDVMRPGARTTKLPVDTTDPTMVWMTEGTAPSEASYNGTQVSLAIRTLFGWVGISNELLEDDEIGLANHLLTKFFRATAKKLDHAIFSADGTNDATHGDFEGIFNFGTAYDLAATKDALSDVTFENFIGLVAGADEALIESPTTRWWSHPQILVQLLGIKDANGRPIFLTSLEAPAAGGIGSILGYPVVTANAAPSAVAAEEPIMAFGDAMGLAVGIRRDMEFASSMDVKFTDNQTVFRQVARAGTKIKAATAFEVLTLGTAT